jgi:hypothetical protein
MRINEAAFVNQGNPHTAAAITAKLLEIEAQLVDLLANHHETTGAVALTLNDLRTLRGRLAPAAGFSGSSDPRIPQTPITMPKF